MKTLTTLILFTFFSTNSFAGLVTLNVGEAVTIQANTQTTVTCGGPDARCATPVKNLKAKFDFCENSTNSSIQRCIEDLWPKFKSQSPQCVEEAYQSCLSFCKSDPFGLDCLNLCE